MHFLSSLPLTALSLLLPACAGAGDFELYDPGELTAEQDALLIDAVRHHVKGEPFDEQLAQIKADPVMAFKFTRIIVLDIDDSRRGREGGREQWRARYDQAIDSTAARSEPVSSDPLLRASFGQRDPVEHRGLMAMDRLGIAAVPCLVEDLARHRQTYWRLLGVELLARIGPPVTPALQSLIVSSVALERRTAAQVLDALPPTSVTFANLRELALDSDYGVRAAALKAMADGGPAAGRFLRERLAIDQDHFVRRSAARALVTFPDVETATALIAYLERCQSEQDADGSDAAQEVLQALAGKRGARSLPAWRTWLHTYRPDTDR